MVHRLAGDIIGFSAAHPTPMCPGDFAGHGQDAHTPLCTQDELSLKLKTPCAMCQQLNVSEKKHAPMTPMRHTNRHNAYSVTRQTPLCGCCSDPAVGLVLSGTQDQPFFAFGHVLARQREIRLSLPQLPVAPDQKCSARGPAGPASTSAPSPGLADCVEIFPRAVLLFSPDVFAPFGRHFRSPAGMAFLPVTYKTERKQRSLHGQTVA